MAKKILFSFSFLFLFFSICASGSDITFPKNPITGPELMKGYVVIRNNSNNGFLIAGTTMGTTGMKIHLMDVHDTGQIIWSKFIEDQNPSTSLFFTSIDAKSANNGYILCGYMFESTQPSRAISIVVDVNSVGTIQKVRKLNVPAILVFAKSIPNGYLITGYLGTDTSLYTNNREAYVLKMDDTLAVNWACQINHTDINNGVSANRFDIINGAEIIIDEDNQDTLYFIHGTYTRKGVLGSTVPAIFYAMLDRNGNLFNNLSFEGNFTSSSCTYDKTDNKIWLVGNKTFDIGAGSSFGMLFKIDVANGTLESTKKIYARESEIEGMTPQMLNFHNIEILEDTLHIFGYIRKMSLGNTQLEYPNISFKISFPKDSIHQYTADFYQSNSMEYTGYLNLFQGYLGTINYDEMSLPVGLSSAAYAPKIGTSFKKLNGTNAFGVMNYVKNGSNSLYSIILHNNSENATCGQLKMYLNVIEENLRPGAMLIFNKTSVPINFHNLQNNNALFNIMYCPGG
jgi:hypothetical protein